jgi:hypothetical protein
MRRELGALVWCVAIGCDGAVDPDAGTDAAAVEAGIDAGSVDSCVGVDDGVACEGAQRICLGGVCVESTCGDRFVDVARGEDCDDGNPDAFDGCEPSTCLFTCTAPSQCDDDFVCNGAELCEDHVCAPGTPAPELTPCDDVPDGVCRPMPAPVCQAPECGNGLRDPDEACDDGRNGDATDGCADDCELACAADGCAFTMTPPNYDFGNVIEGTMSAEQTFLIQHIVMQTSGELSVALAGEDAGEFAITSGNCLLPLGHLGSCMVSVRFEPDGIGARQAMLVVRGDAGEEGAAELRGFALGDNGRSCTGDTSCASGDCVDGFCCDESATMCTGCRACNVAGSEGTCTSVPAGTDPRDTCDAVACGTGDCNGAGACQPQPTTVVCGVEPGCTNSQLTLSQYRLGAETVHYCNGTSTDCPTVTTQRTCPNNYICGATSCNTTCTTDLDCTFGAWCDSGTCRLAQGAGGACTRSRQCRSIGGGEFPFGSCVGGICQSGCSGASHCNNQLCVSGPSGANSCGHCSTNGGVAACGAQGLGSLCNGATCLCTSSTQCTNVEAPHCTQYSTGSDYYCACFRFSNGAPGQCGAGRQCVTPTAQTETAACRTRSGFPCGSAAECVSGSCVNGSCL